MSIKIYIHLKEAGFPEKTTKIQVPGKWVTTKVVKDVIGLFSKAYNDKNPDTQLDLDNIHFETDDGRKIYSDEAVSSALDDHSDYYIKLGQCLKPVEVEVVVDKDMVKCKNYGCQKLFKEEENSDDACQHHTGPPIFHDTMKCWSCCRERKSYDFESFQLITGCNVGRHSTVANGVTIAESPNAVKHPSQVTEGETVFQAPLKSIASYNTENPEAKTAAATAAASIIRKSSRKDDGTAKCQRKGCQKIFNYAENSESACTYHKGQPVFHDAIKFWGCCPGKKCFDFDEFLAVPGCAQGFHDDGVIDLE